MDHDKDRRITLTVPRMEDFEDDEASISVPHDVVSATIELLQGCIAQWKSEIGCQPDEARWRALMAAAGLALGKMVEAYAVHYTATGARRLVDQIDWFLHYEETREHLEAVREEESTAYIVDALLALREETERRRKERVQRAAAQQGPTAQGDAGWDF